jgi:hypothetical protein
MSASGTIASVFTRSTTTPNTLEHTSSLASTNR